MNAKRNPDYGDCVESKIKPFNQNLLAIEIDHFLN